MSLTPKDLVVSRQMRLVDDKVSDAHLRAAIEERARRLAEMKRLHPPAPMRRRVHVVKKKYRIKRQLLTGADQIQAPPDDTKARRWTVRNQLWLWLVLGVCIVIGLSVWNFLLPDFVKEGGPLVGILIASLLFLVVIVVERIITLRVAKGKDSLAMFAKRVQTSILNNDLEGAMEMCRRQRGALANVVYAGLDAYAATEGKDLTEEERMDETRRHLEEANALETPLLERNLVFLSTIASIGTMIGLTGTTLGMIRSFSAMSTQGAPDAAKLALGISEALINTMRGLVIAQVGIVAYNYFVTNVDGYNYMMDETVHEILQLLSRKETKLVS